jgi:hypothetical protein
VAGRDPSTDLSVLRIEEDSSGPPQLGDSTSLSLGHLVLALGRTQRGDLVASSGIIGGISGEWRNRRGGQLDQHIRLDLAMYPGFSGGPLLNARGEVVGMNTRGLAHGRAVTVPVATSIALSKNSWKKGISLGPIWALLCSRLRFRTICARSCLLKTKSGCLSCTSKMVGLQKRPECCSETFSSRGAEGPSNTWMRFRILAVRRPSLPCRRNAQL